MEFRTADGGMENGIWNVFRNNRIEDEEQHRKGINLKKEEMTNMDFLLEAVGIVAAMIYLGLVDLLWNRIWSIIYQDYFKCGNPDPCVYWSDTACTLSGE